LSELMLINNAFADSVIYKAVMLLNVSQSFRPCAFFAEKYEDFC